MTTRVLVVVVNYRSAALTLRCLHALASERLELSQPGAAVALTGEATGSGAVTVEAVVVENASGDEAALRAGLNAPELREWVSLRVAPQNGGFAYGNNQGLAHGFAQNAAPDFIYFLNPDTVPRPGALSALAAHLTRHPAAGIAGSALENEDGTPHHFAFRFPSTLSELDAGLRLGVASRLLSRFQVAQQMGPVPQQVDWVTGASFMVKRQLVEQIGGMDERYFLYFEETDYCREARCAGWECWYVPESRVMHVSGATTGISSKQPRRLPPYWFESRRRYFARTQGPTRAALTDLVAAAAHTLGNYKLRLQGKGHEVVPYFTADLLSHSMAWPKNWYIAPRKAFFPAAPLEAPTKVGP